MTPIAAPTGRAQGALLRQARMTRVRMIRRRVIAGALALFIATWLLIAMMLVTGHDPALARQTSTATTALTAGQTTSSSGTASGSGTTAITTGSSGATRSSTTGSTKAATGQSSSSGTGSASTGSASTSSGASAVTTSQS
jgi:hypothetical protein